MVHIRRSTPTDTNILKGFQTLDDLFLISCSPPSFSLLAFVLCIDTKKEKGERSERRREAVERNHTVQGAEGQSMQT